MKNFRHVNWCLAPGAGTRFASFPIRGSQRCLAPGAGTRFASISIWDRKGAWHRARGRDLPAFRLGIAKVPGTGRGGEICQHFDSDRKGAWHRAQGRDLPAFRFGDHKGAWHEWQHEWHCTPGVRAQVLQRLVEVFCYTSASFSN
jgi:hypothetical protein